MINDSEENIWGAACKTKGTYCKGKMRKETEFMTGCCFDKELVKISHENEIMCVN